MFNECIYTIQILVKEDYIMLLKISDDFLKIH